MVSLDKIRIGDAKKLRDMGLMAGSLSSIEDEIRMFNEFPQINVIIAWDDKLPVAMIKMHLLDRKNCRVHIDPVIAEGFEEGRYAELFDSIVHYSLVGKCYHKLTVTLSSEDSVLEEVCNGLGFVQESVLADEIDKGEYYEDAGLFRILSGDYSNYNVCFVPFDLGVAVITGGTDYIDGIVLNRFGTAPDNGFVRNVAKQLRLLDHEGLFLKNTDGLYSMEQEEIDNLPGEVAKAYVQVSKYFAKNLSVFDLNLRLPYGTEFQKSVWNELLKIKYGSTNSYEDIALVISNGDMERAAKLTRAVGKACSENPLMLAIPCHRVVRKDGKLAGFSAGVEVKDYLLMFEAFSYITGIY